MHLTDIGESDRWSIGGEFDDEDSEDEIGLYEAIKFLDKRGLCWVFDTGTLLE